MALTVRLAVSILLLFVSAVANPAVVEVVAGMPPPLTSIHFRIVWQIAVPHHCIHTGEGTGIIMFKTLIIWKNGVAFPADPPVRFNDEGKAPKYIIGVDKNGEQLPRGATVSL